MKHALVIKSNWISPYMSYAMADQYFGELQELASKTPFHINRDNALTQRGQNGQIQAQHQDS